MKAYKFQSWKGRDMKLYYGIVPRVTLGWASFLEIYWQVVNIPLITSRVSGRGYKNGAVCVCVSVCLSRNLVQQLTSMISWMILMVKVMVKSQGHQVKNVIFRIFWFRLTDTKPYGVTSWRHVTSLHDVMTSHGIMLGRHDVTWHHWCQKEKDSAPQFELYFELNKPILNKDTVRRFSSHLCDSALQTFHAVMLKMIGVSNWQQVASLGIMK